MERVKGYLQKRMLPDSIEKLFASADDYEELMMMYGCAIREVSTEAGGAQRRTLCTVQPKPH